MALVKNSRLVAFVHDWLIEMPGFRYLIALQTEMLFLQLAIAMAEIPAYMSTSPTNQSAFNLLANASQAIDAVQTLSHDTTSMPFCST